MVVTNWISRNLPAGSSLLRREFSFVMLHQTSIKQTSSEKTVPENYWFEDHVFLIAAVIIGHSLCTLIKMEMVFFKLEL